jgi:hypothetical protein
VTQFRLPLTTSDFEAAKINALGVNLSIETQIALEKMILHFDAGFLAQPSGGNADIEFTFAAIFYLGAGLTF